MRDNFRPNVRLATNILMVFGTFLIAINLASVGKQDKKYIQRRDDCADALARVIKREEFYEKYDIGKYYAGYESYKTKWLKTYLDEFCMFYR
tara:strand:- start:119 stop:394 length:276 start_codon:yes stop_codon:yes gene_type:complete